MSAGSSKDRGIREISIGFLIVTVAIVGFVVYHLVTPAPSEPVEAIASSKTAPERLSTGLLYDGRDLAIANLNDFDWNNCEFGLNPHGLSDARYSLTFSAGLKAHTDVIIPAANFADDDGARFDADSHIIKLVSLVCDTEFGRLVAVATPKFIGKH